jgi:hypothetical protein
MKSGRSKIDCFFCGGTGAVFLFLWVKLVKTGGRQGNRDEKWEANMYRTCTVAMVSNGLVPIRDRYDLSSRIRVGTVCCRPIPEGKKGKEKAPELLEMAVRNGAFLSLGICHAEGRLTRILFSTRDVGWSEREQLDLQAPLCTSTSVSLRMTARSPEDNKTCSQEMICSCRRLAQGKRMSRCRSLR